MFYGGNYGTTRREDEEEKIYAKAGRRLLDGMGGMTNYWQLEFQKSIDRHSVAMERLTAALERQVHQAPPPPGRKSKAAK